MPQDETVNQTRRTFCGAATITVLGGALSTLLQGCGGPTGPSNVSSLPSVTGTSVSGGVTVVVDGSSPLATVGNAALVRSSVGEFLVARTAASTFVALTATCTHQTCTITDVSGTSYVCPCHGSSFDTSGHVLNGPAPAALRQYPTQLAGNVLTITV